MGDIQDIIKGRSVRRNVECIRQTIREWRNRHPPATRDDDTNETMGALDELAQTAADGLADAALLLLD